jgi:RND superfamily putative drug exporter
MKGRVTRVDVVFEADPFDRASIQQLSDVEGAIHSVLQTDTALAALRDARIHFVGPTASIRDLKTVTDHDQIKIDCLVLIVVFVILVLLLRRPAISAYLILSVFFSYFVALGVTFAFYYLKDPEGFGGLDWKVPMFLFTILIAIGEDYNIFLMTRIEEEQQRHGPIEGIRIAMLKTGTIISSCGIIMAGTFMSLWAGTLVGMQQLGFALAFGVLLDTFVVRPLLVPAYLVMLYQGRFGVFTRFLGASHPEVQKKDRAKTRPKARVDA